MSLNGLDDPVVTSAYQGALAEGGGWFLLHYVSRDAVDVLARGTGGAPEARAAVTQYKELSPLYGFLLYRRRKVLIKYTPEGTSRLLQARTAVHFTAIAEKFTPHDVTMTIQSPEELSDSALASACSLHTAATSTCSSSSSRKKLSEITEDAEEGVATGGNATPVARPSTAASVQPAIPEGAPVDVPAPLKIDKRKRQFQSVRSAKSLEVTRGPSGSAGHTNWMADRFKASPETPSPERPSLDKQVTRKPIPLPTDPVELPGSEPEPYVSRAAEIRQSLHGYEELFKGGPEPRLSSQTARPAASDLYAEIYAQYNKPKVKLGPRPKVSLDGKRPHTSGTGAYRPVSSLPVGMRAANRRTMTDSNRPKSRDTNTVPSIAVPPVPPVPALPPPSTILPDTPVQLPLSAPVQVPKSPASIKSMTLPNHSPSNRKSNVISPEKQRLLKALELRKKRQQQRQEGANEVAKKPRIDNGHEIANEPPKLPDPLKVMEAKIEAPKEESTAEEAKITTEDRNTTDTTQNPEPTAKDSEQIGKSKGPETASEIAADDEVVVGKDADTGEILTVGEPDSRRTSLVQPKDNEVTSGSAASKHSISSPPPVLPVPGIEPCSSVEAEEEVSAASKHSTSSPPPVLPVPGIEPCSSVEAEEEVSTIVERHSADLSKAAASSARNSSSRSEPPILSVVYTTPKPDEEAVKRVSSAGSVSSVTLVKLRDTVRIPSGEIAAEISSVMKNLETEPNKGSEQSPERPDSEETILSSQPPAVATSKSEDEIACANETSNGTAASVTVPSASEVASPAPESDDLPSASSPVTAQTQSSSAAPSTRPSSLSDDESSKQTNKLANEDRHTLQQLEGPANPDDDKKEPESTESTPRAVPDNEGTGPSVEVTADPGTQPTPLVQISPSEDTLTDKDTVGATVGLGSVADDVASPQPQSKRASMLFSANTALQGGEMLSKRQKRESMVLAVPKRRSYIDTKDRRRTMDPVQISLNVDNHNSDDYLSDDSFMDELQSATVEEAKPISVSVSKSPITPFFQRKASSPELERASTSPAPKVGRLSPEQGKSRKLSGVWPPPQTENVAALKKINVSSGISQRIKALAEKSNRDSSPAVSPLATPDASASIVAQRKSSFFSTPVAGDISSGKPVNRLSLASFANLSSSAISDRTSVPQPPPFLGRENSSSAYNPRPTPEKPESVQVTARIVRDGRPLNPTLTMPTESTPLELHRSEITIDHQKSTRTKTPVDKPQIEPTSPKAPSSSHSKDQAMLPRSSSESSWRSFGRRLSESKSGNTPRSQSAHSSESEDRRDDKKERKDSRTAKLFRRMSSFPSSMRKGQSNALHGGVQEEERPSMPLASLREPPPPVQVGDLNVQFPDTLLWKRRWVEIDAAGNLILSASKPSEQTKGMTKRFHLTEFRTPYAPDQDRQELAHSVVFDFIDGRTLQCACQSTAAQMAVLQVFREAHDAWLAYNQGA